MTAPRRRWSFSLRTLLAVVAIFAISTFALTENRRAERLKNENRQLKYMNDYMIRAIDTFNIKVEEAHKASAAVSE